MDAHWYRPERFDQPPLPGAPTTPVERVARLERVRAVRVRAATQIDLIDPLALFYALSIAAGAVAGMVVATLRVG